MRTATNHNSIINTKTVYKEDFYINIIYLKHKFIKKISSELDNTKKTYLLSLLIIN